jgi:3-oxoacyl-[acyl-carrier-protein] synthase II
MKIAIKEIGVVSPAGVGTDTLLSVMSEGRCLVKPSHRADDMVAAEIEGNLKQLVPRKGLVALSRSSVLAAAAIENLLGAATGLFPEKNPGECGLVVGTAFGHVQSKAEFHDVARSEGVRLVSPILFPNTIINSLAGHAAILFRLRGPNSTVTSGRLSGLEALLRAASLLRGGPRGASDRRRMRRGLEDPPASAALGPDDSTGGSPARQQWRFS